MEEEDVGTMQHLGNAYPTLDDTFGAGARHQRSTLGRRASQRRGRRATLALALSRLEREHVALLLALCDLESPAKTGDANAHALRDALLPMLRDDLRQTQHALSLAAQGQYGACEDCHKPFTSRQLELRPATTRCPICEARSHRLLAD
jgi:hypothetical protein